MSDVNTAGPSDAPGVNPQAGDPASPQSETPDNETARAGATEITTCPTDPELPPLEPEVGGAPGPEPTRYGDWEKGGRCIDF